MSISYHFQPIAVNGIRKKTTANLLRLYQPHFPTSLPLHGQTSHSSLRLTPARASPPATRAGPCGTTLAPAFGSDLRSVDTLRGSRYALSQPDSLRRRAHLARGIRVKPQTSNIYTLYTATILHINLPVSHHPLLVHLRWIAGDAQFILSSRIRRRFGRRSRVVLAFRVFSVFRGSNLSASLRRCVKLQTSNIYALYTFFTATIRHLNRLSSSSLSPDRLSTDTRALAEKCQRKPARPSRKPSLRK